MGQEEFPQLPPQESSGPHSYSLPCVGLGASYFLALPIKRLEQQAHPAPHSRGVSTGGPRPCAKLGTWLEQEKVCLIAPDSAGETSGTGRLLHRDQQEDHRREMQKGARGCWVIV